MPIPSTARSSSVGWTLLLAVALVAATPAVATHADGRYDQAILWTWDTADLDVLIVPPIEEDLSASDLQAVEGSTRVWEDGVDAYGPSWLAEGFEMSVHVVGRDVVPPDALQDPEIVVAGDDAGYGGGFATNICHTVQGVDTCGQTDRVCPATTFIQPGLDTFAAIWNINAHEVGHCLGLGHTGYDGDIAHPEQDIMGGGYSKVQLSCPSNLNVLGLEEVFAGALGRPDGGEDATLAVEDYDQIACSA